MTLLYLLLSFFAAHPRTEWRTIQIEGRAQGTTYRVLYYAEDSLVTQGSIDQLLSQIDSSVSLYKPYSLINQFNQTKGSVLMDTHFQTLYEASLQTWTDTRGLFDITVKPLVDAWGFGVKKTREIPSPTLLDSLLPCVGSDKLLNSGNRLYKKVPCLQIDMNGIAQGYSVDQIAGLLEKAGIQNYLVELGGEIRIKGRKKPSNELFQVGIESPETNDWGLHPLQRHLRVSEGAITTSGSYRNYYESNGQNITHIIHPQTGQPVRNELISVTVWAPDALTADAYDNALMLMGLEEAMTFVESKMNIAAFFIYRDREGKIREAVSSRFKGLL